MANKKYEETDIQAIADTIREKTGSEDSYKVSEMASGVNDVYEAGRSDYSNFIERAISNNGTRTDYKHAFATSNLSGCTFGLGLIKPKSAGYMFYNYYGSYLPDGMDFSGITPSTVDNQGVYHAFRWAQIVYLPDLKIPGSVSHNYLVNNAKHLKKIECLHSLETTTFVSSFLNCNKLAEVSFEGVIGQDISFSY